MAEVAASAGGPDARQLEAIHRELADFVAAVPGIQSAVVASVDGFPLAEATGGNDNGERLAAMTSAMLGLAKAVTRELALGTMEVLLLEAGEGKVLMLSVPLASGPLLLMAACGERTVIGTMLWSARECSRHIQSACADGV